jgi:uncharacterized cupredoxin-like copper-binding protein
MSLKRTCLIACLLICVAVLLNGCGDPDKNKLLFRPELNVARTVNTSLNANTSMKLMGMEMNIGNSREVTYIMTPTAIADDGTVTVEVVYDYVKEEMSGLDAMLGGANLPGMQQMPGMDDMFGTKAKSKALEALKGEKFTVRVSRLGEVVGVEGAEVAAGKLADAYQPPAHIPADEVKKQIRQEYGNENMTFQMKQVFLTTPDKALNSGDTWQEDITSDDPAMPLEVKSTITVGDRAGGILKLSSVDEYTIDFSKGPMGAMMGSGDAGAKLAGQGSGTAEFDEASGWPRTSVSTMKASGSVSPMEGMNMPMDVSVKVEVTSYPKPS